MKWKIIDEYLFELKLKKKNDLNFFYSFDLLCIYLEKVRYIYGKNEKKKKMKIKKKSP